MIPCERDLAAMYHVGRAAVRAAIDELVNQRYLVRVQGILVEYTESYSRPDKLEVRFVTDAGE